MNKSTFALLSTLLAAPAFAQEAPLPTDAPPGAAPQSIDASDRAATSAESAPSATEPAPAAGAITQTPPPGTQTIIAPPPPPPPPEAVLGHPPAWSTQKAPQPRRHGDAGAPFAFGIGGGYVFRNDVAYERLGADGRQQQLELFASYDVLQPLPRFVIAAGLNYRFGADGEKSDLSVSQHVLSAELTARHQLLRWLFPQVRAGIGFSRLAVQLDDKQLGDFDARETAPIGTFAAGILLRTPARVFETHGGRLSSLSLGVLVEGGYSATSNAAVKLKPAEEPQVARVAPALGHLDASGAFVRIMFVLRF